MADKAIGELPKSPAMTDDALLVVYQGGRTESIEGALVKSYARDSVSVYADAALKSAQEAKTSAEAVKDILDGADAIVAEAKDAAAQAAADAQTAQSAAVGAEAAKTQAVSAAAAAAQNAVAATGELLQDLVSDARTAKSGAEMAKTQAEAASSGAVQAKADAETAANAAEASKTAADTAAVTAAKEAENAAGSAEDARDAIDTVTVKAAEALTHANAAADSAAEAAGSQTEAESAAQGASASAAAATTEADRAKAEADRAADIVSGDFATTTEAKGYVSEHNSSLTAHAALLAKKADLVEGKVPAAQLPTMDYISAGDRGKAGGVAELDTTGKVPLAQLPALDFIPSGDRGKAEGVAALDAAGKVPAAQLPVMDFDLAGSAAAVQERLTDHAADESNPHKVTAEQVGLGKTLTFTGAATGTYDGTADRAINIPEGGGKRVARFTVGTSTAGWTAKDCDYLCDGVDDQVEINAAIQALPAGGGEVVILDGVYNITEAIEVNKISTTLSGNKAATILKRMWSSAATNIVKVKSDNCKIQNLTVDGNASAGFAGGGITLSLSSNNAVIETLCINTSISAISIDRSTNNIITGNICKNNLNSGILVQYTDNSVIGNICCNNKGAGIYMQMARNSISGNISNNNGFGIYVESIQIDGFSISGNTCNNNGMFNPGSTRGGIFLYKALNGTVTGNVCNNNEGVGICIDHLSANNTVSGNTCNNNITGIRFYNSNNNNVTGNTCVRGTGLTSDYTDAQHTIILDYPAKNNLISCNNIPGKDVTDKAHDATNTKVNNKYN